MKYQKLREEAVHRSFEEIDEMISATEDAEVVLTSPMASTKKRPREGEAMDTDEGSPKRQQLFLTFAPGGHL